MLNNQGYKYRVVHLIDKLCELENYLLTHKELIEDNEKLKISRISYAINELIFEFSNR